MFFTHNVWKCEEWLCWWDWVLNSLRSSNIGFVGKVGEGRGMVFHCVCIDRGGWFFKLYSRRGGCRVTIVVINFFIIFRINAGNCSICKNINYPFTFLAIKFDSVRNKNDAILPLFSYFFSHSIKVSLNYSIADLQLLGWANVSSHFCAFVGAQTWGALRSQTSLCRGRRSPCQKFFMILFSILWLIMMLSWW